MVIRAGETALLVPVPAAEALVREHRLAHDPVAPVGIPAHITVLYPFVRPAALDESVEAAVADVLRAFGPFTYALEDVRRFEDGIVYLAPEPARPFAELTNALVARWPEYPPYGGGFETVIPHLTVAMANGAPVAAMEAELRAALPLPTRAEEVWLMEGEAGGGWARRAVFPLG